MTHRLPYAPNRGDRIRAFHILRTLSQHARIDLFSLVHDDDEYAQIEAVRPFVDSVTAVRPPRVRNLVRAAGALLGSRPLTHTLLHAPQATSTLRALAAAAPPDAVLVYCSGMAPLALAPPLDRFPVVIDMVDVDSEKWRALSRIARWPQSWIYAREAQRLGAFEIAAMKRARTTIAVNDRERTQLQRMLPGSHVQIVENGIDVEAFRSPGGITRGPTVVFCGVMNYGPNAHAAERLATRIWPRLRARRPDARLLLVGSRPTREVLRLADDPTIKVTGTVPDVRPYLWQSSVAVAPLETARGVQNKVLEAIAAGLPVVVSPEVAAGLPHCVKGACLERDSDDGMVRAILHLLDATPADRAAIPARADLTALNWNDRLQPLVEILRRAASE